MLFCFAAGFFALRTFFFISIVPPEIDLYVSKLLATVSPIEQGVSCIKTYRV